MRLTALKSFRYRTRRLLPGDEFDANDRDARALVAVKRARGVNDRPKATLPEPPPELVARATTVAATEHRVEPEVNEASTPAPEDDLTALRAEYTEVVGRRPFMGWDGDELRRRMAEVVT